jgi:hypothetical protein
MGPTRHCERMNHILWIIHTAKLPGSTEQRSWQATDTPIRLLGNIEIEGRRDIRVCGQWLGAHSITTINDTQLNIEERCSNVSQ